MIGNVDYPNLLAAWPGPGIPAVTGNRALPFAARATRDGGDWVFAEDEKRKIPVQDDFRMHSRFGTPAEELMRLSEINGLMEAASQGRAIWGEHGDVFRVHRHPGIFELRWVHVDAIAGEDLPVDLRLYFAEPSEIDRALVALRFHKKLLVGLSDREIAANQNLWMDSAHALYEMWRTKHVP